MTEPTTSTAPLLGRCTFPPPGEPLVCAVSGGPDSTALLVLATAAGCDVTAMHVDHGLRDGSADEAAIVRETAERFGATFVALVARVERGPNEEARARKARLAVLPVTAATGHTMDDQAETVLLNLLRGSGRDGLAGMREGATHPLLAIRRAETHELCRALAIRIVTDPSNDDPRHLRNRVRHELMPLCADLSNRDPVPVLARQAALFGQEAALLDGAAHGAVPDPSDCASLAAAPTPLARRAARSWVRDSGATAPMRTGTDVDRRYPPSLAEVDRILAVARGTASGTELSGGTRVRRTARRLRLEPPPPDVPPGG